MLYYKYQHCDMICHWTYPSILLGADGKKGGYDCLLIPSAKTTGGEGIANTMEKRPIADGKDAIEGAFCGARGIVASRSAKTTKDAALKKTVCSKYQ